jgi:adenylate cyclase
VRARSLLPILLPCALIAAGVVAAVRPPAFAVRLRHAVFDTYQRWQPRPQRAAPVRVVDIDEESLARLGQWPWPRSRLAELVSELRALGAAAIALDIVLAEPDRTAPLRWAAQWGDRPGLMAELGRLPDPDAVLAAALAPLPVVTGFILTAQPGGRAPLLRCGFATAGDDPRPFLASYAGAAAPLPELERSARGSGALNFTPDADGVVRRLPLVVRLGDALYPSLAAEALRVAEGAQGHVVRSSGSSGEGRHGGRTGVVSVRIGSRVVPTDPQGQVWLHYSRATRQRRLPAWQVLAREVPHEALRGAIVLVGASAAGLRDLRFTPLGETVAGVEIHAELIEQVLHGSFLRRPDWATAIEVLAALAGGAALIPLVLTLGPLGAALAAAAALGCIALGSWTSFAAAGLLLDPVAPSLTAAAVYLGCFVPHQLQRERERRWIRRAFSSYISPNLVAHLLAHPDELRLGGERRECSFVLTDLADFTPLVEGLAPEPLVALLNEYLDGVADIALRHEGTLDRVVGDAVAVMFSAPVAQPDHAARALACALEIDAFSLALRQAKQGEGLTLGRTRIGVHSGVVTVGNVGGQRLLDYRALGDPINTAARLETANRHLGTRICVSGETATRCPGFRGRPVGRLVLKGKSAPIEAFEPLSEEQARSPAICAYLAAYRLLEADDPGARAAFAAVSEDPVAAFHLARLARGETGAVVVFQEK